MQEKPKQLIIIMEGGLIQDIISDKPEFFDDIEVMTINYDDDIYNTNTSFVEQSDGTYARAWVSHHSVDQAEIPVPVVTFDNENRETEEEEEDR